MKRVIFVIVVLFVCGVMVLYGRETKGDSMQRKIASQVIRLHVVANSDRDEDQQLKLEVKEKIVQLLRNELREDTTICSAQQTLRDHLPEVEQVASQYMKEKGYSYDVKAELGTAYFPVKQYGDMTFPAGEYKALKVNIGKHEGKNWWCVMYPTLCLIDSTYEVVPEESKEKLKKNLTEEEYESLLDGSADREYGFKIVDFFQQIFQ